MTVHRKLRSRLHVADDSEPELVLLSFYVSGVNAGDTRKLVPVFENAMRIAIGNEHAALLQREIQNNSQFVRTNLVHIDTFNILL